MGRKIASRVSKSPVPTIIGAGLTEQWYFTHLNTLSELNIKVRPRYFGTEAIHVLEKRIEKVLESGGFAICVFDTDVARQDIIEQRKVNKLKQKYSKKKNVIICDSLPSIEYWFLLHYSNITRYFKDSASVEKELVKFIESYEKKNVFLSNIAWVADMISDGKQDIAISRSINNGEDKESYTNIHKVFQFLQGRK